MADPARPQTLPRRYFQGQRRRTVIYAEVSATEHRQIYGLARRHGLTLSDLIRRALNNWIFENEDEDAPMLNEKRSRDHAAD